jgi:hypothetical protein
VKEWLPILSSLLTLVLGWVLRGGYIRFTERGRLPDHIDRRLAIWKQMPDGQAKDELRERIESDVRYLLAHDVHPTTQERNDRRFGWGFVAAAPLVAASFVSFEGFEFNWRSGLAMILGLVMLMTGGAMVARAHDSRDYRRMARLAELDPPETKAKARQPDHKAS